MRAQSIIGRMGQKGLYCPFGAPWFSEFRRELLLFDAGKNDDQVDALGLIGQILDKMVGAGKSSLIEQLCARTKRPFIRVNCTGDMDSSMIFGQLTAKDGSTHWVDGAVTEAVKYGAVFAWDEWDVTPPEISMGLQWLLEDNGKLFLKEMPGNTKDRQIIPHEHFKLVAIGNTQGQGDDTGSHAGTNVQNSATLDRFGTAVYIGYLAPDVEEKMIQNKWSSVITKKATKELVKLANLVRQGYTSGQLNLTLSPRSLFSICKKLSYGSSLTKAYQLVYLNKLNETQRKVANELFVKVYGTSHI
jgi:cobaltochelatase CobS